MLLIYIYIYIYIYILIRRLFFHQIQLNIYYKLIGHEEWRGSRNDHNDNCSRGYNNCIVNNKNDNDSERDNNGKDTRGGGGKGRERGWVRNNICNGNECSNEHNNINDSVRRGENMNNIKSHDIYQQKES